VVWRALPDWHVGVDHVDVRSRGTSGGTVTRAGVVSMWVSYMAGNHVEATVDYWRRVEVGLPRVFRFRWFLALVVVAVIVIIGVAISFSRSADQLAPAPSAPASSAAQPHEVSAHETDKNWLLASYQVANDGTGFFTGRITVTNQAPVRRSGFFELVISVNGHQVGTLYGQTVTPVDSGATVVVDLPIGVHYVPGPYTVDFHEAYP
jgi:hypothetical protein